jgi:excisionase family DNA binding protein
MTVQGLPVQPASPKNEPYISREELAELMGVSVRTITNLVREGMPSKTFGLRVRRFRASTALAWANARNGNVEDGMRVIEGGKE